MAIDIQEFIEDAKAIDDNSLYMMIKELEDLGDDANGNSPEYKLLKEAIALIVPGGIKVILKCNYDVKTKDGVETKKPDTEITLPVDEANKLLDKAWAIKVVKD